MIGIGRSARRSLFASLIAAAGTVVAKPAMATTDYYVSPTGVGTGGCMDIAAPCAIAFMRQDQTLPDSTIWMRGGTYPIVFDGNTSTSFYGKGTPGHPLIIRNYNNERVTITVDAGQFSSGFITKGHDVWYWGIEFIQTQVPSPGVGDRITTTPGSNFGPDMSHYGSAFTTADGDEWMGLISNVKVINCILHDGSQGFTVQNASAPNFEAYGNLVYYNGSIGPDRGHGHGYYVQGTQSGNTYSFKDNIVFHNFSHDFQAYGSSSAWENNMLLDGNIMWGASDIHGDPAAQGGAACADAGSCGGGGREFVVGGTNPATGLTLTNNMFYKPFEGDQLHIGWSNWPAGQTGVGVVTGNYIATDLWLENILIPGGITITGNTFVTDHEADYPFAGYHTSDYPSNTWGLRSSATGSKVFVRPNAYDSLRGNVAIYNWSGASTVPVDISSLVPVGSKYAVLFAMDYFGTPVLTGTYGGGNVDFPMTGLHMAAPHGNVLTPPAYFPAFAAFVVVACSSGCCVACAPSSPCKVATCNSSTGACDETMASEGSMCSSGTGCLEAESCDSRGSCVCRSGGQGPDASVETNGIGAGVPERSGCSCRFGGPRTSCACLFSLLLAVGLVARGRRRRRKEG